jgi:cytoskeletal protein RodZ
MSSTDRNRSPEKKKKIDYFEWFVWTVATIIIAMLAAHWVGLY